MKRHAFLDTRSRSWRVSNASVQAITCNDRFHIGLYRTRNDQILKNGFHIMFYKFSKKCSSSLNKFIHIENLFYTSTFNLRLFNTVVLKYYYLHCNKHFLRVFGDANALLKDHWAIKG
jgi:hypothetical protein